MAKETRQILNGVRIGQKVYTQDGVFEGGGLLEDADPHAELAKVLDSAQIARLTQKGHLSGFEVKNEKENKENQKNKEK